MSSLLSRFQVPVVLAVFVLAFGALYGARGGGGSDGKARASAATSEKRAPHEARLALGFKPVQGEADRYARIGELQRMLTAKPSSAELYAELALSFMRRRREASDPALQRYAEDALRAARDRDPGHPRVLLAWTMELLDRHQFQEAANAASGLIQKTPGVSVGHLLHGDALLELGRYADAASAYQRALDIRPDLRSYNRGAHLRWLHGDEPGARELLALAMDAASPRDPESLAWCLVDLGEIQRLQGAPEAAVSAADKALKLVDTYVPALELKARALHESGQTARAIETMHKAAERLPSASSELALAEWLARDGRVGEAQAHEQAGQTLAEADPRPLAHYLARRGLRSADALRLSQRAVSERPTLESLDTHALALWRVGRFAEARAMMQRALALATPRADFLIHQGLIALALHDEGLARKSLAAALALQPQVDPLLVGELRGGLGL